MLLTSYRMFIPNTRHYSGFYMWTREEDLLYREHGRLREAASQVGLPQVGLPVTEFSLARGAGRLLVVGASDGLLLADEGVATGGDGSFALVDGALYNRSDIERELSSTRCAPQRSDPELVLAAYEQWGANCLARLYGDYALVAWHPGKALLCGVSPGERWLYFSAKGGVFRFATHPALLIGDAKVRGDREYFARVIQGWSTGDHTPYEEVRRLRPGYAVVVEDRGCREFRWWKVPEPGSLRYRKRQDYEQHLRDLLKEAVRCRIAGHRHVCISLSGGIDSGSVAACVAELARSEGVEVSALTFSTPDIPLSDESPFARETATRLGIPHEPVALSKEPVTVEKLVHLAASMPFPTEHVFFADLHVALARAVAQRGGTIFLNGGGGELFWGCFTYLINLLHKRRLLQLGREILHWRLRGFRFNRMAREVFKSLQDGGNGPFWGVKEVKPWLRHVPTEPSADLSLPPMVSDMERFFTQEPQWSEMMHSALYWSSGVMTAAPYMDRRVFEFAFAIPLELRVPLDTPLDTDELGKPLLRSTFPEIPSDICRRAARVNLQEYASSAWICCGGDMELRAMVRNLPPMFDEVVDRSALIEEVVKLRQPSEASKVAEAMGVALWEHGLRQQGLVLT
jgi:asparagine synthetase B (glutamine-hydrolysing)